MKTRNTFLWTTPAWVALGTFMMAAEASAQLRPRPGHLNVGHSEQGRVTDNGTHSTGDGNKSGFRLTYGGDEGGEGTSFGGSADVDFRKSTDSRFIDLGGMPGTHTDGGWIVLYADVDGGWKSSSGILDRSGHGTVPAPGTALLLGMSALLAARRKR